MGSRGFQAGSKQAEEAKERGIKFQQERSRLAELGRQTEELEKQFKVNITDLLFKIQEAKNHREERVKAVEVEFGPEAAEVIDELLQEPATTIMTVVLGNGSERKGRRKFEDLSEALTSMKAAEKKVDRLIQLKEAEAEARKQIERRLSEGTIRAMQRGDFRPTEDRQPEPPEDEPFVETREERNARHEKFYRDLRKGRN